MIKADDTGNTIRVRVTAANAEGFSSAVSGATAGISVGAAVPANTSPPTIGGSASTGSTLTANPGGWRGAASFAYQWLICDGNGNGCRDINSATAQTYQIRPEDQGNTIRVRVTAANAVGFGSALSGATARISGGATAAPAYRLVARDQR